MIWPDFVFNLIGSNQMLIY